MLLFMAKKNNKPLVGLICGGGGFTSEMLLLTDELALDNFRFIITGGLHFDHASLVKIQELFYEKQRVITVENPSLITLGIVHKLYSYFVNIIESFGLVFLKKFDVFLGLGSYLCVPIFIFSRFTRKKCIYIECLTRVNDLSSTGRFNLQIKTC